MNGKTELCNEIHEIYPAIGGCGKDLNLAWSSEKNVWDISIKVDGHSIRHYLEDEDAAACWRFAWAGTSRLFNKSDFLRSIASIFLSLRLTKKLRRRSCRILPFSHNVDQAACPDHLNLALAHGVLCIIAFFCRFVRDLNSVALL